MTTTEAITLVRDHLDSAHLAFPNSSVEERLLLSAALTQVLKAAEDFVHLDELAQADVDKILNEDG